MNKQIFEYTQEVLDGVTGDWTDSKYNWDEFITFAPFSTEEIQEIYSYEEGYNDGDPWELLCKANDKYYFVTAWCDYTGWDCQCGGNHEVYDDIQNLISKNSLNTYSIGRHGKRLLDFGFIPDWKYE